MRQEIPTPPKRKPVVMSAPAGTTVSIGNDITVEVHSAYRGRAVLHVRAPSNMAIDRERNFAAPQNDDGPSVGAPEPSTK